MNKVNKVKPNYRIGNKNEILILLHITGIIPYKSIRLLADTPTMYQRAIRQMKKDGVVEIKKRGTEKYICLQKSERQKKKYQEYLPENIIQYYKNYGSRNLWKMTEKVAEQNKVVRDTDAQIFFYACGYHIGPYTKDINTDLIGENENSYYSSREIKRIEGYTDGKSKTNKKVTASRVNGILINGGENYIVYNLGNQMIEWKRFSEIKMATYVTGLIRKRSIYEREAKMPKEAIVLASTDRIYHQICELNYERNRTYRVTLMNIDYSFQSIYAVPADKNGKLLIRIMKQKSWKHDIRKRLLSEKELENKIYTTVQCDGYDTNNDIYTLIFCIPDLVKLKAFTARANLESNPKKYRIYCFTYQIPLIMSLAGTNVTILKTDINAFYDKYYSEKEIDNR